MAANLDHGGSGHCLCGAVRYAFDAAPNWQAHCHCESCRRNCSAPFTSYFGVSHGQWRWTGAAPSGFTSSPGVIRHFCGSCGTPMAFQSEAYSHELHFYAASLDTPQAFQPSLHVHWDERLPWVKIADGLSVHRSPRRLSATDDPEAVLTLIRTAFAGMEGRIDPPSSMNALTSAAISALAKESEIWTLNEPTGPIACVFLTAKEGGLYVGKLAVAEAFRGQGLARQLIGHAKARARALGLPALELQTRVELVENHAAFTAMGFVKTAETAHPGFDRPTSYTFRKTV